MDNPVYIEDCSRNGTFINRDKLGSGKKRILANNDYISISHPAHKVFVYKELRRVMHDLPEEITKKYHIGKKLGSGSGGTVLLVHNFQTCQAYALKHIKKNVLVDLKAEKAMNEVKIMTNIKHPCVVRMNDIIDTPESVFIMLELMQGGDLLRRIQGAKFLHENLAKLYFYQICQAIKYLHDRKITHRDLKPDNILLATREDETLVKVSDFGLSKLVQNETVMKTMCGTLLYVAPEVLLTGGRGEYTEKVDVWSLGVVLFCMLSGTMPFSNTDQIKNASFQFTAQPWAQVTKKGKTLVSKMMAVNVDNRPSIDEVLRHPWLATDYDMICKAHKLMQLPAPPPMDYLPNTRGIFIKPYATGRSVNGDPMNGIVKPSEPLPIVQPPPPKRRRLC